MLQRKFEIKVQEHFPNALDAKDTSIHFLGQLQNDHGINVSKMLMATSLCSDDINVPSTTFFNVLFGPFIMGGLGGIPFAGHTGMISLAKHIPDNGTAFIFYGPHIGITIDGDLGMMYRPRQDQPGDSCGALMLALRRMKDPSYVPEIIQDDYQQTQLETYLAPYKDEILAADIPAKKITECMYTVIDQKIHAYLEVTKDEFAADRVALLGGIIINTDFGLDDYFDVRNFEVVNLR